jgi:hypothetical protein
MTVSPETKDTSERKVQVWNAESPKTIIIMDLERGKIIIIIIIIMNKLLLKIKCDNNIINTIYNNNNNNDKSSFKIYKTNKQTNL